MMLGTLCKATVNSADSSKLPVLELEEHIKSAPGLFTVFPFTLSNHDYAATPNWVSTHYPFESDITTYM